MSKHGNLKPDTLEREPFFDRCLPTTSMSSVALLTLLARWAFADAHSGGLRDTRGRLAACDLLTAFARQACGRAKQAAFIVVLTDEWECRWPRPAVILGDAIMEWKFVSDGFVHMGDFMQRAVVAGAIGRWRTKLVQLGVETNQTEISILDLFRMLPAHPCLQSLFHQVVWAVSKQLEGSLGDQSKGEQDAGETEFRYEEAAIKVGAKDMEERLVQYVAETQREVAKHSIISIATDKASPAGQSLSSSLIVLGDNKCAMCCPIVALSGYP